MATFERNLFSGQYWPENKLRSKVAMWGIKTLVIGVADSKSDVEKYFWINGTAYQAVSSQLQAILA